MTGLSPYLRAAHRKHGDPEAIFQTAATRLDAKQLARLVSDLRATHRDWKLHKRQRDPLIDDLLAIGVKAARIAEQLGCHPRTVARRVPADAEGFGPTPTHRINKRAERDKTRVRAESPILSFDASSGAVLTAPRHRQLLHSLGVLPW